MISYIVIKNIDGVNLKLLYMTIINIIKYDSIWNENNNSIDDANNMIWSWQHNNFQN